MAARSVSFEKGPKHLYFKLNMTKRRCWNVMATLSWKTFQSPIRRPWCFNQSSAQALRNLVVYHLVLFYLVFVCLFVFLLKEKKGWIFLCPYMFVVSLRTIEFLFTGQLWLWRVLTWDRYIPSNFKDLKTKSHRVTRAWLLSGLICKL